MPLTRPFLLAVSLALWAACGDDDGPSGPSDEVIYRWTSESDFEGWAQGMTTNAPAWGTVTALGGADHLDNPPPAEEGSAKLDGVGDPGEPNAWIYYEELDLPSDAATLAYFAAGHNRDGANANLRVRLVDEGGTNHTLRDWEEFTGIEGVHNWEERTVSITAFAGQTVTLFFEQDDNGPGTHEQIYLDEVRILRD